MERWYQTLKNRILPENYFLPGDLEAQIERGLTLRNPQSTAPAPVANPPKWAKLIPGVSLTRDKSWVQRQ